MKSIARLTGVIIVVLTLAGFLLISAEALQEPVGRPTGRAILQQPTQVATTTYNVELIGQIGGSPGPVTAVEVRGNYAYIGFGARLAVLDISNPAIPTLRGQTGELPDPVEDIHISGSIAYVAAGEGGLRVIDISNPDAPVAISGYDTPGWASGVHVADDYAYVADGDLLVLDVTDPNIPRQVTIHATPGEATDIYITDRYAYLADGSAGLSVIDISDSPTLVEMGRYSARRFDAQSVFVAGDYAYVGDGIPPNSGLGIIDISDPLSLAEIGYYHQGEVQDVHVVGDYAYVADTTHGFQVLDVRNPAAPVYVMGGSVGSNSAWNIDVDGDYAYIINGEFALWVIDISNPERPAAVGTFLDSFGVRAIHVVNGYAYVGTEVTGMRVLDVSDPTAPVEVGAYPMSVGFYEMSVTDRYAYVAAGSLQILDVSNAAAPVSVNTYDIPGGVGGIDVAGNYAYVVGGSGLLVLDISDPITPREVGVYSMPRATAVQVAGNHAYVVDRISDLRVIDISDPTSPVEVGSYRTPGSSYDVYVNGNYVHLPWSRCDPHCQGGLAILDVSNPATPREISIYDTQEVVLSVDGADSYIYLASRSTLDVIDVSNPAVPIGVFTLRGGSDVYIDGDYAFVAAGRHGLRVIDISDPTAPVQVGAYDYAVPGLVAQRVRVADDHVYVASDYDLRIIDVSDPKAPVEIGAFGIPEEVESLEIAGNHAYVAAGLMWAIDVSGPAKPHEVGTYHIPGQRVKGIDVASNYAYLIHRSCCDSGLHVVDVSNAALPVKIGAYDGASGYAQDIRAVGNYAYVVYDTSQYDLEVFDVSDPVRPAKVSSFATPLRATSIYVAGNFAYVTAGAAGLRIIDVSDPTDPREVSAHDTPGDANDVYVADGFAYVADGKAGLRIIDVSDPAIPVEVGSYDTPGESKAVYSADNYIYLADASGGLLILQIVPSVSTSVSVSRGGLTSRLDQTTYVFAANTFTNTVTVTHTPRDADNVPPTGTLVNLNHFFNASVVFSNTGHPAQPTRPYTVTVQYTDVEKGTAVEDTLALYSWDGEQWVQETTSVVNTEANTVTATPTHFGLWAVLGTTHRAYLPIIAKQHETWLDHTLFPRSDLADKIWQAVERFVDEYPPADIYPGYAPEAGGP